MSLKINSTNRLTRGELEDYRANSGITELQFQIVSLRYYSPEEPTITAICMELNISPQKYNRELHKALRQIAVYRQNNITHT